MKMHKIDRPQLPHPDDWRSERLALLRCGRNGLICHGRQASECVHIVLYQNNLLALFGMYMYLAGA